MKTILIDSELGAMSYFEDRAQKYSYATIIGKFTNGYKALEFIRENEVELVVMDIHMPGMDGIELGKQMREVRPDILFILVSRQEEVFVDVFQFRAVAYLLKPYEDEDVFYAMESAYLLSKRNPKRVFARTFGYFDLFIDGKPMMFKSAKAKELLALLIDRHGGVVDSDQIIATLWNDRPKDEATQSLCSKLCKTLNKELKEYGIEELLISSRSNRSINLDMISCDLYEMLDGNEEARKQYYGEYLTDYEWAEYRNYSLSKFV